MKQNSLHSELKIKDEIPVYLVFPPIESPETAEHLEQLNATALANGWESAIKTHYANDQAFINYVLNPARGRYIELLELGNNDVVLEIGPGLGQFTRAIAPHVNTLHALEVVEGQARFVAESCRQMGYDNVRVACGGDNCELPYPDQSMDLVVMNLVLEWCGDRNGNASPETMQNRYLAEIARVLKPGGRFYVCTKNRYALKYILGKPDEHCQNLRFGNALPRWLMFALLRLKGLTRPNGWLHSHNALARMLDEAGFHQLKSYWAAPEMRFPDVFIENSRTEIEKARRNPQFRQGEMRSTNAVMKLIPSCLVKYFTPGLVFLATKS